MLKSFPKSLKKERDVMTISGDTFDGTKSFLESESKNIQLFRLFWIL